MSNNWILITEQLPPFNELVALINIKRAQSDPAGDYPVAYIGHLSKFGDMYWSIMGERGTCLNYFTHWAALPPFPKEFMDRFDQEKETNI